jgi:hypothetical protein
MRLADEIAAGLDYVDDRRRARVNSPDRSGINGPLTAQVHCGAS